MTDCALHVSRKEKKTSLQRFRWKNVLMNHRTFFLFWGKCFSFFSKVAQRASKVPEKWEHYRSQKWKVRQGRAILIGGAIKVRFEFHERERKKNVVQKQESRALIVSWEKDGTSGGGRCVGADGCKASYCCYFCGHVPSPSCQPFNLHRIKIPSSLRTRAPARWQ